MGLHNIFDNCCGAIFDLNGVLVDDEFAHEQAFRDTLKSYGYMLSHCDYLHFFFGFSDLEGINRFKKRLQSSLAVERILLEKHQRYLEHIGSKYCEMPGAVELIRILFSHKIPLSLVSASQVAEGGFLLDVLEVRKYFNPIIFNTKRKNPGSRVYSMIADQWKVNLQSCIVIDDNPNNLRSATNIGIHTIAVTSTFPPESFDMVDLKVRDLSLLI